MSLQESSNLIKPTNFKKNVLSTDLLIKTHLYSGEGNGSRRIDRRRATHNEVERRRRDTINAWIMQLGRDFLINGRNTFVVYTFTKND